MSTALTDDPESRPLLSSEELPGMPSNRHSSYSFHVIILAVDVVSDKALEQSLVKKLDRRMSILILIYILNCKYLCAVLSNIRHSRL
jgi:hypothetical protein